MRLLKNSELSVFLGLDPSRVAKVTVVAEGMGSPTVAVEWLPCVAGDSKAAHPLDELARLGQEFDAAN
jgi:hypothetical protein